MASANDIAQLYNDQISTDPFVMIIGGASELKSRTSSANICMNIADSNDSMGDWVCAIFSADRQRNACYQD